MNVMSPDAENLQQSIIKQLDVRPFIDPEEEIARRVDFLVEYLKMTHAKGYVLGISGGQDSTLAGKLTQLAVERVEGAEPAEPAALEAAVAGDRAELRLQEQEQRAEQEDRHRKTGQRSRIGGLPPQPLSKARRAPDCVAQRIAQADR